MDQPYCCQLCIYLQRPELQSYQVELEHDFVWKYD